MGKFSTAGGSQENSICSPVSGIVNVKFGTGPVSGTGSWSETGSGRGVVTGIGNGSGVISVTSGEMDSVSGVDAASSSVLLLSVFILVICCW